jgi:hypothetical protein
VEVVEVGLGEKEAVAPAGRPESDKVTAPLNPFNDVTVTVELPASPCCIVSELGEEDKEKSGDGAGAVTVCVRTDEVLPPKLESPEYVAVIE